MASRRYLTLASKIAWFCLKGTPMGNIDKIRAFNRFYTRKIGLVGRNYVSGAMGLSEMRVLFELNQPSPPTARHLAVFLSLDEGYLSRILAKFTKNGWLSRCADPGDRRVSRLALTEQGREQAERFLLEANAGIAKMLAPVNLAGTEQVVRAMEKVEAILSSDTEPATIRNLRPGDSGWLIQQHAELYHKDEGFDVEFEALVADILAEFIRNHDPACERAFIAEQRGERLGSVFCVRQSAEVAKLRLFILVPEARGQGLGQRLIDECLTYARGKDYKRMTLWTHKSQTAACALYAKNGFHIASEELVHVYGADRISQIWEIEL